MLVKLGKRICALLLTVFLLLGAVPVYSKGQKIAVYPLAVGKLMPNPNASPEPPGQNNGGKSVAEDPQGDVATDGNTEGEVPAEPDDTKNPQEPGGPAEVDELDEPDVENEQYIITEFFFDDENENARVTATVGTAQDELDLPPELEIEAKELLSGEPSATSLEIDWYCENYDPEVAGEYVFTTALPKGWSLDDGVLLPEITVELTAPLDVTPLAAVVPGSFVVNYSGGQSAAYNTFTEACNFVNSTTGSDFIISVGKNDTTTSLITLSKPCKIEGNGYELTSSRLITFQERIELDNVNFVLGDNSTIDAKTLLLSGNNSSIKRSSFPYEYITFANYDKNSKPIDGNAKLILMSSGAVPDPILGYNLIAFYDSLTAEKMIFVDEMLDQIELDYSGFPSQNFNPILVPAPEIGGVVYAFVLKSPAVRISYTKSGTSTIEYRDYFSDAVSYVNGTDLNGATNITLSLYQDQNTNGVLPSRNCTIKSVSAVKTLTSSGGFTLNSNVEMSNIDLASSTANPFNVNCGSYALTLEKDVTFTGGANIMGGNSGTLVVRAPAVVNSTDIGTVTVNSASGETFTVSDSLKCGNLNLTKGTADAATAVNCDTLNMADGAMLKSPAITCTDAITMASGSIIETLKVDTGKLSGSGEIVYTGSGSYSAGYILNIGNTGGSNLAGLTISMQSATLSPTTPINPNRIIQVPAGEIIDTSRIILKGNIFDDYALELEKSVSGSYDYYVLNSVKASVTPYGTSDIYKFTSFEDALDALDGLTPNSAQPSTLNLWVDTIISAPIASGSKPCVIDGRKPGGDSTLKTLSSASLIELGRDITFANVKLNITGSTPALDAKNCTLTMSAGASFINTIPEIKGTGTLIANAGALFTCDKISGFGNVKFTGSTVTCGNISGTGEFELANATGLDCGIIGGFGSIKFTGTNNNVKLNQLTVKGSLASTASTKLTFRSSNKSTANIIFENSSTTLSGFSGLTVDNTSAATIGDYLIQVPKGHAANYKSAAGTIALSGNYSGKVLRAKIDNASFDYFVLSEAVGKILLETTVPPNPTDPSNISRVYGDTLTFKATLQTSGSSPSTITDWEEDEAKVEFFAGSISLGEGDVLPNGTASLTVTQEMYKSILKASATAYTITTKFTNQPAQPTDPVVSNTVNVTVTKKPVGITANAISGGYSKAYDGSVNLPSTANSSVLAGFLTLTASDILSVDSGSVGFGAVTAEFTDKNVGTVKNIKFNTIPLNNTNYEIASAALTALNGASGILTDWKITPAQLNLNGITIQSINKTYDKTTAVLSASLPSITLTLPANGVASGESVTVKPKNDSSLAYRNSNAGTNIPIDYSGWEFVTADTAVTDNYILPTNSAVLSGNIAQQLLTFGVAIADGVTEITKTYDGDNSCHKNQIKVTSPSGLISGDNVVVGFDTATFSDKNANGSAEPIYTVTVKDFTLSGNDKGNYYITPGLSLSTLSGTITKAPATVNPSTIGIFLPLAATSGSYDLSSIHLNPVNGNNNMDEGDRTSYSVAANPASFFSASPTVSSGILNYTSNTHASLATCAVTLTFASQNYYPSGAAAGDAFDVAFNFNASDKTELGITGITLPGGKPYNGNPIGAYDAGSLSFTKISGNLEEPAVNAVKLEYWYTDVDTGFAYHADNYPPAHISYKSPNLPTNAGNYILHVRINDEDYTGEATFGPVVIDRVGLVIKPNNLAISLGDTVTYWNDFNGFTATGLVNGETLSTAFGSVPFPFTVYYDPNVKLPSTSTVTITAPDLSVNNLVGNNYKITSYQSGTVSINGAVQSGWIKLTPPTPDGANGWYKSAFDAESNRPQLPNIGLSPSGAFNSSVIFSTDTASSNPSFYLSSDAAGTLVSDAYTGFTYKLDATSPALSDWSFVQEDLDSGILSVKAADATSGIDSVSALVALGISKTMTTTDGITYSCTVTRSDIGGGMSFAPKITATDKAGNATAETAPSSYAFFEVTGIKITMGGSEVTSALLLTKGDSVDLVVEILPSGQSIPNGAFVFDWQLGTANAASFDLTGSYSENAEITALIPNPPELAARSTLVVSAMGVNSAPIDVSFCTVADPADGIDGSSQKAGVEIPAGAVSDIDDTVLLIEQLSAVKTAAMQNAVWTDYPEWKNNSGSRWYNIRLMDKALENELSFTGSIDIYLPVPDGSTSKKEYLLIHDDSGILNDINKVTTTKGLSFSVDSLSPFAMIWKNTGGVSPVNPPKKKKNTSFDNDRFSTSGGGGGNGGIISVNFWNRVKKAINSAQPGSTVIANVPSNISTCPVSVLKLLADKADKNITLRIIWKGKYIDIRGKKVILPSEGSISFYYLKDLFEMYEVSQVDVTVGLIDETNPKTGGDGGVMVVGANGETMLVLPSTPNTSKSGFGIPFSNRSRIPGSSLSPASPNAPAANADTSLGSIGKTTAAQASGQGVFAFIILLILIVASAAPSIRRRALSLASVKSGSIPVVIVDTVPETTTEVEDIPETTVEAEIIPETTVEAEIIPETATEAEIIPETTAEAKIVPEVITESFDIENDVISAIKAAVMAAAQTQTIAVQARADAAKTKPVEPNIKVAEPKTRVPEPKARIAAPKANEHAMESKVFSSLTEQYKRLKLEFENGIITAAEYESRKRKLVCNF